MQGREENHGGRKASKSGKEARRACMRMLRMSLHMSAGHVVHHAGVVIDKCLRPAVCGVVGVLQAFRPSGGRASGVPTVVKIVASGPSLDVDVWDAQRSAVLPRGCPCAMCECPFMVIPV